MFYLTKMTQINSTDSDQGSDTFFLEYILIMNKF